MSGLSTQINFTKKATRHVVFENLKVKCQNKRAHNFNRRGTIRFEVMIDFIFVLSNDIIIIYLFPRNPMRS